MYALQHVVSAATIPNNPEQVAAVRAAYEGKDVFVRLPTGFAKSLCYEALPFVFDWKFKQVDNSLVLVASPLVALMVDQHSY